MTLTQLRLFNAACQVSNITKAAQAMNISQPSVTNAIKALEDEFGVKLIERESKGFKTTSEGELLYTLSSSLLDDADRISRIMNDMGKGKRIVRIGIPPMVGAVFFPWIYKGFSESHKEIQIITEEDSSKQLLQKLEDDKLDLIIVPMEMVQNLGLETMPLQEIETVFCVNRNHPLANRATVSIEDIKDEPLVMLKGDSMHSQLIAKRFLEKKLAMNTIHSSTQLETVKQFISAGVSSGLMYKELAMTFPDIVPIPFNEPINMCIGLVWKKKSQRYSSVLDFIDYMASVVAGK